MLLSVVLVTCYLTDGNIRSPQRLLGSVSAVVIEGPKASGKTATARQAAESEVLLDTDRAARRAAELDPSLVLEGSTPRLLDEWQVVPQLWNHIRRAVDERGRPGHLNLTDEQATDAVRAYLDGIRRADIGRVDGVDRDPHRVGRLLSSLARNVATYASLSTVAADTGRADGPLARSTVLDYLSALDRLMVTEDQPPWAPHLRSKARLMKLPGTCSGSGRRWTWSAPAPRRRWFRWMMEARTRMGLSIPTYGRPAARGK